MTIGVASIPIALFILTFTGVVIAIQASYTFTGTVPLYFVLFGIVDESFVRHMLGGRSAVGQRIRERGRGDNDTPGPWMEIVGVTADMSTSPSVPSTRHSAKAA